MRVAIGLILGLLLAAFILIVLIWLRGECCCCAPCGRPPATFKPQSTPAHPLPEPGTLALLATGAAGLWLFRR